VAAEEVVRPVGHDVKGTSWAGLLVLLSGVAAEAAEVPYSSSLEENYCS